MYCHRCQACLRLYSDPEVRKTIRANHEEMYADVLQSAYLDEQYTPESLGGILRHGAIGPTDEDSKRAAPES